VTLGNAPVRYLPDKVGCCGVLPIFINYINGEISMDIKSTDLHSQGLKAGENLVTSGKGSVILRVATPRKGDDGNTYWESVPQSFVSGFQTSDGRIAIEILGQQVWLFAKTNGASE